MTINLSGGRNQASRQATYTVQVSGGPPGPAALYRG